MLATLLQELLKVLIPLLQVAILPTLLEGAITYCASVFLAAAGYFFFRLSYYEALAALWIVLCLAAMILQIRANNETLALTSAFLLLFAMILGVIINRRR